MDDVLDRQSNEVRLSEDLPVDDDAIGQRWLERIEHGVDLFGDHECVCARRLLNGHDDRRVAAVGAGTAFWRRSQTHGRDLSDRDRSVIVVLDDRSGNVRRGLHAPALADGKLEAVNIGQVACAERAVSLVRCRDDFFYREVIQPKFRLLDEDLVLGQLAADDRHLGDPWNGEQLVAEVVLRVRAQLERLDDPLW